MPAEKIRMIAFSSNEINIFAPDAQKGLCKFNL